MVSIEAVRDGNTNSPAGNSQKISGYQVTVGRKPSHIRSAQRLRHQIFAGEFGAITPGPVGFDADSYDEFCDHIVVWFRAAENKKLQAVATYRLLPPGSRASGLYAESEFDLSSVRSLLPFTVESGRSCVRADHRNGTTMALLWSAIAEYMLRGGHRYLIGCTSISLADGGELASGVWAEVQSRHRDASRQCLPHRPYECGPIPPAIVRFPALLKGYLRLGATILGPPALDPMFNCADFLILLDLQNSDPRYLRRFLPAAAPEAAAEAGYVRESHR